MRERVKEMKASASRAEGEKQVLEKIAEMPASDRALATRVHAIVRATAPELTARTWYGMPAYAKEEKIVCWFQNASKFKVRYATLGFSDEAELDDGRMWPVTYALTEITRAEEAKIASLVKAALRRR